MTGQDVRNRRFVTTRWREGYDPAGVDALLGRVAGELDGRQGGRPDGTLLTAEQVVQARFEPTVLRQGYDQDEVDDFLDEVVLALRAGTPVGAATGSAATGASAAGGTADGPATAARAVGEAPTTPRAVGEAPTAWGAAPADTTSTSLTGSRADRATPYELLALRAIGWLLLLGGGAAELLALTEQPLGLAALALGGVVSTLASLALVRVRAPRRPERPGPG